MMPLDHIVMGEPCQFWFKRPTGSMAPILLSAAEAKEVLELWFETGGAFYDPKAGVVSFREER